MDTFAPYGVLHAVTLGACALAIAGVGAAGLALRGAREKTFRRVLGLSGLAYWITYNIWWNWRGLDLASGLPLHLCDLNGLAAPLALLTQWRWLRATLYFWTFTLSIQAFIQPVLTEGPAQAVFWWFWAAHTLIVACAVYDLVVLRFRPDWADLRRAAAVSFLYLAVIVPVNYWLDANYGFLGNPASGVPPFIAMLGPWPLRAVIVVMLAVAGFVLVLLPWRLAARRVRTQP